MRGWPGAGQRVGNGQLMLNGYRVSVCDVRKVQERWWHTHNYLLGIHFYKWTWYVKRYLFEKDMYPLFIAALFTEVWVPWGPNTGDRHLRWGQSCETDPLTCGVCTDSGPKLLQPSCQGACAPQGAVSVWEARARNQRVAPTHCN